MYHISNVLNVHRDMQVQLQIACIQESKKKNLNLSWGSQINYLINYQRFINGNYVSLEAPGVYPW